MTGKATLWDRRKHWTHLVLMALLASGSIAAPLAGQEVQELEAGETLYEFRLVDGSVLIARVTSVDGDKLVLTTSGGARLEVLRAQIRDFNEAIGRVVDGEFWNEDPNHTRLYVSTTGRSLRQGQAYIGTYLIVFPFVAVGVTDRFSVAAGAPILLGQLEPVYVAPKFQIFNAEKFAFSVGALALAYDNDTFGVAFGTATLGDTDGAVHIGVGFGFSGTDFSSRPVAMVGAEKRLGRSAKFLTENYFLPGETGAALSAGFRFIGRRITADVGVGAAVSDDGGGCCLPLVSFSYGFGKR